MMIKGLEALKRLSAVASMYCDECATSEEDLDRGMFEKDYQAIKIIEKELKALEILSEHIIINEKNGYIEFFCDFSLPTNSKYENEEHFKEKIDLLKEVLL